MSGFRGEYEATIDAKGRFMLPGGIKKQLPDGINKLIVNRGFENCLSVYTPDAWEIISSKITQLPASNEKARAFRRFFLSIAEVEFDSANRILIPTTFKSWANLEKDIVLTGDVDKIEIWDAKKRNQFFEKVSAEELSAMAADLGDLRL